MMLIVGRRVFVDIVDMHQHTLHWHAAHLSQYLNCTSVKALVLSTDVDR